MLQYLGQKNNWQGKGPDWKVSESQKRDSVIIVERRSDIAIVNKMEKTAITIDVVIPRSKEWLTRKTTRLESIRISKERFSDFESLRKLTWLLS